MFGLNEILSIVILIINICLIISEYKNTKGKEILTNAIITLLLIGVSISNLVTVGFSAESIIVTVVYILNIIGAIIYTVLFIIHYFKNRNNKDDNQNNF